MKSMSTTFATSRTMTAPPEVVFAAFADPQRLARWWGPDGFSNVFEVFEFQPGGAWVFKMIGPDGTSYPNVTRFQSITPDRLVVIELLSAPHFVLTVTLAAQEGGTRVSWQQVFEDDGVAEAVRHIVVPANEQNLNRWVAELGGA
jgi:uncharacterized protein YndB with AHSA1/START domain